MSKFIFALWAEGVSSNLPVHDTDCNPIFFKTTRAVRCSNWLTVLGYLILYIPNPDHILFVFDSAI